MNEDTFLEEEELRDSFGGLDDLINEIESGWGELSAAARGLSNEEMTRPGVAGPWSLKDVFAHIAAWEEEGARRIDEIANGPASEMKWPTREEEDQFNARAVAEVKEKTIDQVVKRLEECHQDLMDMLAAFGEELMMAKQEVPANEWVPGWTYLHYQEHAPQIWGLKNSRA